MSKKINKLEQVVEANRHEEPNLDYQAGTLEILLDVLWMRLLNLINEEQRREILEELVDTISERVGEDSEDLHERYGTQEE